MDDDKVFDDKPLGQVAGREPNYAGGEQMAEPTKVGGYTSSSNSSFTDSADEASQNLGQSQPVKLSSSDVAKPLAGYDADARRAVAQAKIDNWANGSARFETSDAAGPGNGFQYPSAQQSRKEESATPTTSTSQRPIRPSITQGTNQQPPGPRETYQADIVPDHQQTYEESVASATAADRINDRAEAKQRGNLVKIIVLIAIALILISGAAIGTYFYLKITNSPKYVLNKAFQNLNKSQVDLSVLYQKKSGTTYDDKFSLQEFYDSSGNKQNQLSLNINDSRIIRLDITQYGDQTYLEFEGLEVSAPSFSLASQSLAATVGSAGKVLDGQWFRLDDTQKVIMPSDLVRAGYQLSSAIEPESIVFERQEGQQRIYSFDLSEVKFKAGLANLLNSQDLAALDQFNIKYQLMKAVDSDSFEQLKFEASVDQKTSQLTELKISDGNQDNILSLKVNPHKNQTITKPDQVKTYSEITSELQAATSQSGVDLAPVLVSQ